MRVLALFLIFGIFNNPAFSQTSFGIKTGMNLSKAVYTEDDIDDVIHPYRKIKPGFVAGICVVHQLNPVLSVETDLLYSQKGLKFVQQPFHKVINSMNYIELPVSGQLRISGNKTASLYAELGGFAAWWTDGRYIELDFDTDTKTAPKVDFKNEYYKYSRIDAGILAGILYKLEKLTLTLRYTHSMTGSSEINADALSNRVFTVGLIIKM